MLGVLPVLAFDTPADEAYAAARAVLEVKGTPIGVNDWLFAAQALALGMVAVTDNERKFARVRGLKVENWLK